jgi:hypothetical protein
MQRCNDVGTAAADDHRESGRLADVGPAGEAQERCHLASLLIVGLEASADRHDMGRVPMTSILNCGGGVPHLGCVSRDG